MSDINDFENEIRKEYKSETNASVFGYGYYGEPFFQKEYVLWLESKIANESHQPYATAILPHVMSSCHICQGRGEYTTGGSFGGPAQVHKCDCGAITP